MLTSLTEYAKLHGKSGDTIRRIAERGAFQSAHKIGRNWVVDSEEEYPVRKRAPKNGTRTVNASIVSLFSGCGGMDLGFIGGFSFLGTNYPKTGFEVIWANDISSAACNTYRMNIGNHISCADFNLNSPDKLAHTTIEALKYHDHSKTIAL